jgi:hypothetical protein
MNFINILILLLTVLQALKLKIQTIFMQESFKNQYIFSFLKEHGAGSKSRKNKAFGVIWIKPCTICPKIEKPSLKKICKGKAYGPVNKNKSYHNSLCNNWDFSTCLIIRIIF